VKLPWWRVAAGGAILLALAAVLLALAPVYLANYRLQGFLRGAVRDADVRQKVVQRARDLALPVADGDITENGAGVEIRYAVRKDFGLYQVDLHFHPTAKR
jgi:hypothetical protein